MVPNREPTSSPCTIAPVNMPCGSGKEGRRERRRGRMEGEYVVGEEDHDCAE
jgi:hypothetical protein